MGALIVYLTSAPAGGELEARPKGDDGRRFHTGVHSRATAEGEVLAAVFPAVAEGTYELLDLKGAPDATVIATADVVGGEVCEIDLR